MFGLIEGEDVRLKCLGVTSPYLDKDVLLAISDGCGGNDEILKGASCLKVFDFEGAKLEEDYMDDNMDIMTMYTGDLFC